jgi:hypothetical protein
MPPSTTAHPNGNIAALFSGPRRSIEGSFDLTLALSLVDDVVMSFAFLALLLHEPREVFVDWAAGSERWQSLSGIGFCGQQGVGTPRSESRLLPQRQFRRRQSFSVALLLHDADGAESSAQPFVLDDVARPSLPA